MTTPPPSGHSKDTHHADSHLGFRARWRGWLHVDRIHQSTTARATWWNRSNDEADDFDVVLAEGWSPFCGGPCLVHQPMFVLRAPELPAASGPAD